MRYFLTLCLIIALSPVAAGEKVILQLKWEHEFQFAGYYAALWQGYYSAEGLDVEIKPASTVEGKLLNPVDAITSGRAHFSIGEMDILLAKDQGHDLVILAPIFQRNPVGIFALQTTHMANVGELANLRIAAPKDNNTRAQVQVLFRAQGIDPGTVSFVDVVPNVASLQSGLADAIATSEVSAKFQSIEKNITLKTLSPADYGLDFYGDSLYTSRSMIDDNPDRVERFVSASLKGWQYALQHRNEIAEKISRDLPRHIIFYDDFLWYNQTFSRQINEYLAYPYLQVGHNNIGRWYRMIDQLRSTGVIEGNWDVETLFRQPPSGSITENLLPALGLGFGFIILAYLFYLRRHKKLVLPYILILAGIVLVEVLLESSFRNTQLNNIRLDVSQQLGAISSKLSGSINRNLSIINGLAAHIAINPSISQEEFERYASAVFQRETHLINVGAAPDLVVTMIYPFEANKGVLGLDYRLNQAQREAVLAVKNSGEMIVAGPVNLVQGGTAFIGRTAVYTGDRRYEESFWGIVSAPFDAEEFYQSNGLRDLDLPIEIAIRGNDGLGSAGDIFFGEKSIFDDKRSILTDVSVGAGIWQMAARPRQGWDTLSQDIWILRASTIILSLMLMLLGLVRFRQLNSDRLLQDKIQRQATYDLLTDLPNRFLFENRLDQAITAARRYNRKLAVLFIDLDNFKPVNDHLGHKAGDEVLKQVGERAGACIRESDTLARYSGDEFTILLNDLENESVPLNVAEKILQSINLPFDIDGNQIFCSASIGISIYPDDGRSAEELVSNADHAMYEVKKSGRNAWHFFTETMQEYSEKRHILRTKLAAAMSAQQLQVYYQPIIELSSDRVSKCEALVRWSDESGNQIPTVDFISVAEETGMINEIDRFVLDNATRFLINQNNDMGQAVGLSVNVSPRLFSAKDKSLQLWMDLVSEAAKDLEITVEITERLLTEDSVRALETLNKLKLAGVDIAIDDFGTGYSSLSYLTIFPIDIIKIDRSFIKNIGENRTTEILTDTIISLAQQLSLKVVAEGVETREQLSYLRKRDCEYAQGYLLGKPQNQLSFIEFLKPKTRRVS